jgi:hypothetical protein
LSSAESLCFWRGGGDLDSGEGKREVEEWTNWVMQAG